MRFLSTFSAGSPPSPWAGQPWYVASWGLGLLASTGMLPPGFGTTWLPPGVVPGAGVTKGGTVAPGAGGKGVTGGGTAAVRLSSTAPMRISSKITRITPLPLRRFMRWFPFGGRPWSWGDWAIQNILCAAPDAVNRQGPSRPGA